MNGIDRKIQKDIENQKVMSNFKAELSRCTEERKIAVLKCKDALSVKMKDIDKKIVNTIKDNLSKHEFEIEDNSIIKAKHSSGISYTIEISQEKKYISKSIDGDTSKGFTISYKNNLGNIDATESSIVIGSGTSPEIDSLRKKVDILKKETAAIIEQANNIGSVIIKLYGKSDEGNDETEYKSIEKIIEAAL